MIYYAKSDLTIRNIHDSDIPSIIEAGVEQGGRISPEELRNKLKGQEKLQNFMLVALYKGEFAGYVNVCPFSHNGPLGNKGYSEICDFTVFKKYENLGIEHQLMDVAENVGAEYSDTVYLCVGIHKEHGKKQRIIVDRRYSPDGSGVWDKNGICDKCSNCENENELVLWFYKQFAITNTHKLPIVNTPERPFLKWWRDRKKSVWININNLKSQKINVNDEVTLVDVNSTDFVKGKVIFKHEYESLENLIKTEGVRSMLPFLKDDDFEKALQFYQGFSGAELIEKFGCVAFEIKISDVDSIENKFYV